MTLFKELNRLMLDYNFYPSKKKAQNFVIDPDFVLKLVALANLQKNDVVLEVGAGTGFLTRELIKHCNVIAVELDDKLCVLLKEKFSTEIEEGKLVLLEGNALEMDFPKFNKVVSLPPYTISSDLMYKLALINGIESMTFVFQREFVQKCTAIEGYNQYGPLSVLLGYFFDSKIMQLNVSPENFFPKPSSFSSLVVFHRNTNVKSVPEIEKFVLFLRQVFRLRNKNLSNALEKSYPFIKKILDLSKKDFDKKLASAKLDEIKVYQYSPKQFAQLFQLFLK